MKGPVPLGSSKIGTRFQVTLPKKAREMFDIKSGDILFFICEEGKLLIKTDY